ncbi:MAG: CocE/NonD family hydrolase [Segetibacter sp.]
MRDGTKLFTAIYFPDNASGKFPILMVRTPYSCSPYGEDNYTTQLGPEQII